jgi:hypothetical protein
MPRVSLLLLCAVLPIAGQQFNREVTKGNVQVILAKYANKVQGLDLNGPEATRRGVQVWVRTAAPESAITGFRVTIRFEREGQSVEQSMADDKAPDQDARPIYVPFTFWTEDSKVVSIAVEIRPSGATSEFAGDEL